jgi:hypothetical protein
MEANRNEIGYVGGPVKILFDVDTQNHKLNNVPSVVEVHGKIEDVLELFGHLAIGNIPMQQMFINIGKVFESSEFKQFEAAMLKNRRTTKTTKTDLFGDIDELLNQITKNKSESE